MSKPVADKQKYLSEHKPHFGVAYYVKFSDINSGDVIAFKYKNEMRWVFVLDPNFDGKLHGLTLGLTPRSLLINEVVDAMFDLTQPYDLYYEDIYHIARDWDSYRTYFASEIKNPRRMAYYITPKPAKPTPNKGKIK